MNLQNTNLGKAFEQLVKQASKIKGTSDPLCLEDIIFIIQEIPYGRPSEQNIECILSEWKGTCSGKHLVLHQILTALGFEASLNMGQYQINSKTLLVPFEKINSIAEPIWDIHNFLRADPFNNLIDITWPTSLAEFNFIVTQSWKKWSDFDLVAPVIDSEEIDSSLRGLEKKRLLLEKLNGKNQGIREEYIQELEKFFTKIQNQKSITREQAIQIAIKRSKDNHTTG